MVNKYNIKQFIDSIIPNNNYIDLKVKLISDSFLGFALADSMGVPVEFSQRYTLKDRPVEFPMGFGTYNQPVGTWSDDTSMTLCILYEILENGTLDANFESLTKRFLDWKNKGHYTPYMNMFDIGITVRESLCNYEINKTPPIYCGGRGERDNGNGALMRMLPITIYCIFNNELSEDEKIELIFNQNSITHGHGISHLCTLFYYNLYKTILNKAEQIQIASFDNNFNSILQLKLECLKEAQFLTTEFIKNNPKFKTDAAHLNTILISDFTNIKESEIKSTGFVIHTLEAVLWSFINSNNYSSSILKAINLGGDTDTIGAITGSISGLFYGLDDNALEWISTLARKEEIIYSSYLLGNMCNTIEKPTLYTNWYAKQ